MSILPEHEEILLTENDSKTSLKVFVYGDRIFDITLHKKNKFILKRMNCRKIKF